MPEHLSWLNAAVVSLLQPVTLFSYSVHSAERTVSFDVLQPETSL